MPVNPTYPGVYIDEVASQVRTIVGVPTAIAAFVGPASQGPTDAPRHVTSWGDFERIYGGLSGAHPMTYSVRQYFQHGGAEAEIVRVAGAAALHANIDLGSGVSLQVTSPGKWGDRLRARVDYDTSDPTTLWNLTLRDTGTGLEEQYRNISPAAGTPRSLDRLLQASALVRSSGADNVRPAEHAAPVPGKDPFEDLPPAGGAPAGGAPAGSAPAGGAPAGGPAPFAQAGGGDDGNAPGTGDYTGSQNAKTGVWQLLKTDIFNMLCIPPVTFDGTQPDAVLDEALDLCVQRRAMLLVDPPATWTDLDKAVAGARGESPAGDPGVPSGDSAKNAAVYFPRFTGRDANDQPRTFTPSGAVAGIWARSDAQAGVWKAPAGTEASVNGVDTLDLRLTDLENGRLNPLGVNCLRTFPVVGTVTWGARTLRGADRLASEWKYVPVRRTALFIEESLYRGTQWVVFKPNDEPLWASVRLNVGSFMGSLFRQGAFQGATPREAYLVKCDRENNPQAEIDKGILHILVGFAPLKPAEFVLIHIQQLTRLAA